ncbi:MAG TPA: HNH endonuclease [Polyangiaceae bacterium]|nr:HNH endonuclease [Polyangiaceae bacterium]
MAQAAFDWDSGLEQDDADVRRTPESPWQRAHTELVRLAKHRAGLDVEEGRWLLAALREGTHVRLGFGSFNEYSERMFGYGPKVTQEKLRVAEALEELPMLAGELRAGTLNFSVVKELTRVATRDTEGEWLQVARGKTVREVEPLVSGRRQGNRPDDAADPRAKRHVVSFEVSGEVFALLREALAKIRREASEALDDDAALHLLSRYVLGGARDEGRSSYQVALTVCERCGAAKQHGRGELVEVGEEVAAMAACDVQHIGTVGGAPVGGDLINDAAHVGPVGGALVDDAAHVGATGGVGVGAGRNRARATTRAKQTIPPSIRRSVLRRDGGRCRVPGCRHAVFVDAHHIQLRAEGGRHDPENLVTLCGAHHLAVHRGELIVDGARSGALVFRHSDGKGYGSSQVSAAAADIFAKAFQALRNQGFREGEIRRALASETVRAESELAKVFRAALLELAPARSGR